MKLDHLERELGPPAAGAAARAVGTTRARRRVPAGDQGRGRRLPDDGDRRPPATRSPPSASARTTASRSFPAWVGGHADRVRGRSRARAIPRGLRSCRWGRRRVRLRRERQGGRRSRVRDQARLARGLRAWLGATRDPAEAADRRRRFQHRARRPRCLGCRRCGAGKNLASDPERERLRASAGLGPDRPRTCVRGRRAGPFAYWDYTGRGVPQRVGAADRSRARHPAGGEASGGRSWSTARSASRARARASRATTRRSSSRSR